MELQRRLGSPKALQSSAVMMKRVLSILMNLPNTLVALLSHRSAFLAPTSPV